MRGREKDMGKKTGLLLLLAALLCLALAGAAAGEELPQEAQDITLKEGTDPRIPWVITVYECGCRHTYLGAMTGRYGMVLSPYSLYCPEHGDKYREITFEFGCTEEGEPVAEYSGEFTAEAYETFQNAKIKWENIIAYIRFEEPVGDQTGWFECRVVPDKELKNRELLRRRNARSRTEPPGLLEDTITVKVAGEKELTYDRGDFVTGTPVLMTAEDSGEVLVGLCNYWRKDSNYVRRITKRVYNDMKKAGILE